MSLVNTIEVFDVLGQLMVRQAYHDNTATAPSPLERAGVRLDISNLASGIYFLKATDDKGMVSNAKFVKE